MWIELFNRGGEVGIQSLKFEGLTSGAVVNDNRKIGQFKYLVIYRGTRPTRRRRRLQDDVTYFDCNSACGYDNTMNRNKWSFKISEPSSSAGGPDAVIDEFTYDSTKGFPTIAAGFTAWLINNFFNNALGSNWRQSCAPGGTPGGPALTDCSQSMHMMDMVMVFLIFLMFLMFLVFSMR